MKNLTTVSLFLSACLLILASSTQIANGPQDLTLPPLQFTSKESSPVTPSFTYLTPEGLNYVKNFGSDSYFSAQLDGSYYIFNSTTGETYNINPGLAFLCHLTSPFSLVFTPNTSNLFCKEPQSDSFIKLKLDPNAVGMLSKDESYTPSDFSAIDTVSSISYTNYYDEVIFIIDTDSQYPDDLVYRMNLTDGNLTGPFMAYSNQYSSIVPSQIQGYGEVFAYTVKHDISISYFVFNITSNTSYKIMSVKYSNRCYQGPYFLAEGRSIIFGNSHCRQSWYKYFDVTGFSIQDDGSIKYSYKRFYTFADGSYMRPVDNQFVLAVFRNPDTNKGTVGKFKVQNDGSLQVITMYEFPVQSLKMNEIYIDNKNQLHIYQETTETIVDISTNIFKATSIQSRAPYLNPPPINLKNGTVSIGAEGLYFFDENGSYDNRKLNIHATSYYYNQDQNRVYFLEYSSNSLILTQFLVITQGYITWTYDQPYSYSEVNLISINATEDTATKPSFVFKSSNYYYFQNSNGSLVVRTAISPELAQFSFTNWDKMQLSLLTLQTNMVLNKTDYALEKGEKVPGSSITAFNHIRSLTPIDDQTMLLIQAGVYTEESHVLIVNVSSISSGYRNFTLLGTIRKGINVDYLPHEDMKTSGFYTIDDQGTLKKWSTTLGSIEIDYGYKLTADTVNNMQFVTLGNKTVFRDSTPNSLQRQFMLSSDIDVPNNGDGNNPFETNSGSFLLINIIYIVVIVILAGGLGIALLKNKKLKQQLLTKDEKTVEMQQGEVVL